MKSTYFAFGSLLATIAIAQPHRQHQAFHHKRIDAAPVVWVTELDYVTETVGVTTTIWVSEGFVEPSSSHSSPSKSSSAPAESATPVPAQFFEPAQSSTPVSTPTPTPTPVPAAIPATEPETSSTSSSSVYVAPPAPVSTAEPATTLVSIPVVSVEAAAPSVASVASVPSVATVAPYVAPTSTYVAPVATPVASTAPAPAPASSSSSSSSSGSGGSTSYSGDITHYTAGMGACGWDNDGSTDKVVALPHGLMGTQSNGNPYCGKTITIKAGGQTTTAEVTDKCMGCDGYSIDLSDAAWSALGFTLDVATDIGRTTAEWYFN